MYLAPVVERRWSVLVLTHGHEKFGTSGGRSDANGPFQIFALPKSNLYTVSRLITCILYRNAVSSDLVLGTEILSDSR